MLPLVAALAPVAGSLIGGGLSAMGQNSANKSNEKIANKQMEFQERMSSTAHQREKGDLIAAGLNPLLTANAGASTPAGATATMQNANEGLASSAKEIGRMPLELAQAKAGLGLVESQTNQANAQATKARVEAEVAKKDLPRSDFMNKVYGIIRPSLDKITESMAPSALSPRQRKIEDAVQKLNQKHNIKRMP